MGLQSPAAIMICQTALLYAEQRVKQALHAALPTGAAGDESLCQILNSAGLERLLDFGEIEAERILYEKSRLRWSQIERMCLCVAIEEGIAWAAGVTGTEKGDCCIHVWLLLSLPEMCASLLPMPMFSGHFNRYH